MIAKMKADLVSCNPPLIKGLHVQGTVPLRHVLILFNFSFGKARFIQQEICEETHTNGDEQEWWWLLSWLRISYEVKRMRTWAYIPTVPNCKHYLHFKFLWVLAVPPTFHVVHFSLQQRTCNVEHVCAKVTLVMPKEGWAWWNKDKWSGFGEREKT